MYVTFAAEKQNKHALWPACAAAWLPFPFCMWCCPCALSAVWALLPAMGGAAGRPFRANCCTEIAALMWNLRRKRFLQTLVLRCAYETSYCFARRIINCFQNTKRHPLRIQFAQKGNLSGLWSDCRLRPLGWASLAISSEIRDDNTGKHVFFRHFSFSFIGDTERYAVKEIKKKRSNQEITT